MTTPIRTAGPTLTRIEATTVRATPPSVGGRFRQALSDSAGVVLGGLEAVAGAVPGGSIVTAAVRGAGTSAGGASGGVGGASSALSESGGGGESAEAPASGAAASGSVEGALAQSADQNMYFLKIQEQLQSENRRYSALSNVLKARHETVKNAIGNIR